MNTAAQLLYLRDHSQSLCCYPDRCVAGIKTAALINASIHYVLPGTKNFLGVEINDELEYHNNNMIVRPQFKMTLSPASSVGLALGISTHNKDEPLDFLIRWIYELRKKN